MEARGLISRSLLVVVVAAAFVPLAALPALACSCAPPESERDAYAAAADEADVVLVGDVDATPHHRRLEDGDFTVRRVRVKEALKGEVRQGTFVWNQYIENGANSCAEHAVDGPILLFASDGRGFYGSCGPTTQQEVDERADYVRDHYDAEPDKRGPTGILPGEEPLPGEPVRPAGDPAGPDGDPVQESQQAQQAPPPALPTTGGVPAWVAAPVLLLGAAVGLRRRLAR